MFLSSKKYFFYKANRAKPLTHPLRRWVPFLAGAAVLGGAGVYETAQYIRADREAQRYGDQSGELLCGAGMVDFLSLLPLNAMSAMAGVVAGDTLLPPWMHQRLIQFFVWRYDIDLNETAVTSFPTFEDFYTRPWKPEKRPVDANAVLIAPCDGEVLSVMDEVHNDQLVQVKGFSYNVYSLFRLNSPPLPAPHWKRTLVVIKVRREDFHRVIAPRSFCCHGSVYVPGTLLPLSKAWYHYIPGVLTLNERVVLHGSDSHTPVYLALIGSALNGKIKILMDGRIKTNTSTPPEYSIRTTYKSCPLVPKGHPVGVFQWGSTVVVMTDIPETEALRVKSGDTVKAGEALTTRLNSSR